MKYYAEPSYSPAPPESPIKEISYIDKFLEQKAAGYVLSPGKRQYHEYIDVLDNAGKNGTSVDYQRMTSAFNRYIDAVESHDGSDAKEVAILLEHNFQTISRPQVPDIETINRTGLDIAVKCKEITERGGTLEQTFDYIAERLSHFEASSWPIFAHYIAVKANGVYPVETETIRIAMNHYRIALQRVLERRTNTIRQ